MSDYTKHLRLIKPAGNEYYNVDHFNHNAELIDKETEDLSNKVTEIQQGATREKAGIVQFGTEEGKALEGMMLARLAGCVGYGGDIQEPGVKDINYIYYDRNTRKMYKCLNQNSDISANVANFIPLDNNSLLDRLENLINFREEVVGTWENAQIRVTQLGKIGIVDIVNATFSNTVTTINLPTWFVSKKTFVSSLYSKEDKRGAEISISDNKMYVYVSEKTTDLTGQIIAILN